jgi:hypothetical protein
VSNEMPFPRTDLAPQQHQLIRDLLVERAVVPIGRRRPVRQRFGALIVPAAALAVAVAVTGVTVGVRTWDEPAPHRAEPAVPAVTATAGTDQACLDGGGTVSAAEEEELAYSPPVPAGYTESRPELGRQKWCSNGIHPVVSFVQRSSKGPDGTLSAAVTVSRLDASPEELAEWPNVKARTETPRKKPPVAAVSVRSQPGVLQSDRILTWREPDGRYWSVTGSGVTGTVLVSIADDLELGADSGPKPGQVEPGSAGEPAAVDWPGASDEDFERIEVPADTRQEGASTPYWMVIYERPRCGACFLSLEVSRSSDPWAGLLAELRMPIRLVDVNGEPGVLAEHGSLDGGAKWRKLKTQTADGVPVVLTEAGSEPTDLLAYARNLAR